MEAAETENSITEEIIATDTSTVANHVVAKVCGFPLKLYCPFCCSNNSSESWLKEHIRNEHENLLELISVEESFNSLHSCHFCYARFYTDDLVIKHIAKHHEDNFITLFQERKPNQYIVCGFCPYKVLNKYKPHLVAHVEKNHFTEFKIYIGKKCSQIAQYEKLQYSLMKESGVPNLNALFMSMSIKENIVSKEASLDQSECNSSFKFINQNIDQLLDVDGNVIDKFGEIKNTGTGSEFPIRRKLRFDLPEINKFKKSSKENIISCSTNMKLMTKHIPKPSKVKPIPAWKSVFSFKRKQTKRHTSVSKLVTSTPSALDFQTGIRRTEYDKCISVMKHRHVAKDKPTASINEDRRIFKKYSVDDTRDDTSEVVNKDVKNVISRALHPASLEMGKDTFHSCTPPTEMLKQFECAICFDSFAKNIDLLTHVRQQHIGPFKLLQPSYKCGQCEAKFYKNSYLVKHCRFHHTPRCLTNKLPI